LALVIEKKLRGLTCLVGNTPLLAIEARVRGSSRLIYAKCEQLNFTGSVKDRIALYILSICGNCSGIAIAWYRLAHEIMNQLQATALNEGLRYKKKLWREAGRKQLESSSLASWASRRREDLLEVLDRINPTIAELTQAIEEAAEKCPQAR
jgi:hypothetical protein